MPQPLETLNPMQQQTRQTLNQRLQPFLSNTLQQKSPSFEPIRQQALGTFQSQIVPQLAEMFGGGSYGSLSGPLQARLSSAGGQLASNLGAQEAQFGQQQYGYDTQRLNALLGHALRPTQEFQQESPGFIQSLIGTLPGIAEAYFSPGSAGLNALSNVFGGGSQKQQGDEGTQEVIMLLKQLLQGQGASPGASQYYGSSPLYSNLNSYL